MAYLASSGPAQADVRLADRSLQLDTLRLFLIVALVFLRFGEVPGSQTPPVHGYVGQSTPITSIAASLATFFSLSAVPMLAAISGWLFFKGAAPGRPPDYRRQWLRRVRSLLAPSVIWSAAAVAALAAAAQFGMRFSALQGVESGFGAWTLVNAVLGITEAPAAIQFWFVRDLVLSVALAPLVWLIASRAPVLSVALLTLAWLADQDLGIFLRLDTFLFFVLGAALAIHRVDVTPDERLAAPLAAAFALALAARTLAPWLTGVVESVWLDLATSLMRVIGVAALWSCAGILARGPLGVVAAVWGPAAFFIYCAHYPLVSAVKRVLAAAMRPESDLALLAHFVTTVGLTLALIAVAIKTLGVAWPGLLALLSGGRLDRRSDAITG